MTKVDFIAELRGIETGGSAHCNDPEVWGCIHGAALAVQRIQNERREAIEREHAAYKPDEASEIGW